MLKDKIESSDWDATSSAIEEQVARQSYVEWLREQEDNPRPSCSNTVQGLQHLPHGHPTRPQGPQACASTSTTLTLPTPPTPPAPIPGTSWHRHRTLSAPPEPAVPGAVAGDIDDQLAAAAAAGMASSTPPSAGAAATTSAPPRLSNAAAVGFETRSFISSIPPAVLGLADDWEDEELIAALAASQQDYIDQLKKGKHESGQNDGDDDISTTASHS